MKKIYAILTLVLAGTAASVFFVPQPAHSDTSGAPAGRTGSPGDGSNCTVTCHTGNPPTVQAGLITSNIPGTGYAPGFTYHMTATVTFAGRTKFGFEVSPQSPTGTKLGNLVVTNTTETKILTSGKYITHKSAGTSGPTGTRTWNFDWVAPAAGTGTVTFYGAFNCTNSSSTSAGDIVYLSTLVVNEDLSGIHEQQAERNALKVWPTLAEQELFISPAFGSETEGAVQIKFYSLDGRLVKSMDVSEHPASGVYSANVAELASGTYVVAFVKGDRMATQRFIKP